MTMTTNEKTLIETELELLSKVEALRTEITKSRKERRSLADSGDSETVEEAQKAYEDARAKVARLTQEKADAEGHLDSLNTRLDRGDESVGVDDVVSGEKAIERLTRLLKPAKAELQRAERALKPLLADQHLAHLAADIVESVTDVPVIVRRKPSNAPKVSPSVILSQFEATDAYGTLDASGTVKVTEVGVTGVDWKAVTAAFDDLGCEGTVSSTQITFDRAAWPLPRLFQPSVHALASYMSTMQQAWSAQVTGGQAAQRLIEAGYSARSVRVEWTGLMHRAGEEINVTGPGEAEGEAVFLIAAQHERGDSLSVPDLESEIATLVNTFRAETIGGYSEAGEIASVELVDVKKYTGDLNPWSRQEVAHVQGSPMWPVTAECRLKVTYKFEEA